MYKRIEGSRCTVVADSSSVLWATAPTEKETPYQAETLYHETLQCVLTDRGIQMYGGSSLKVIGQTL